MKKYLKVLLVLVMFLATPVFALSDDLFRADDKMSISDDLNGSSFIAGNDVEIDSKVDGILFSAGNYVNQSGESEYLFTAGNVVKVNSQKTRDAYIAGADVSVKTSKFERDAFVAGNTVIFDSTVGRHAYIGGSKIVISGTFNGNLSVYGEDITIEDNTIVKGELKYPEDAKINISKSASIASKKVVYSNNSNSLSINTKTSFKDVLVSKILSLANLFIVGLLLMIIFPKIFEKIKKMDNNTILSNLGFGALTIFALPITAIALMVSFVGISAGVLLLDFYFVCMYLSTMFTSYYFSNMILGDKINNKYLILLIGVTAIFILKLIPFISILTSIFAVCIGFGIVVKLIFDRK